MTRRLPFGAGLLVPINVELDVMIVEKRFGVEFQRLARFIPFQFHERGSPKSAVRESGRAAPKVRPDRGAGTC